MRENTTAGLLSGGVHGGLLPPALLGCLVALLAVTHLPIVEKLINLQHSLLASVGRRCKLDPAA